jgi:GntR family transcriptional regulator, transcriptional repressor for pyruvate dehydrogenase complex
MRSKSGASDRVISQLKDLMDRGELRPGDRLPPERDLAESLGVSRASLREGVRALASLGVVEARQGSGAVLASDAAGILNSPFEMVMRLDRPSLEELYEARRHLEGGTVSLASLRRSDSQLERLREAVARMESALGDPIASAKPNADFHAILAEMSGNRVLARIIDSLIHSIQEGIEVTNQASPSPEASLQVHLRILRAVEEQDPKEAVLAMDAHMDLALSELALIQNRRQT